MTNPTQRIHLQVAAPRDAEQLAKWWADGAVMAHAGFPKGIVTNLDNLRKRLAAPTPLDQLYIIEDETHQPIGEMHYSIEAHEAKIGIKLCDAKAQGKGLGPIALKKLIHHLFIDCHVQAIILDTMIENTRAQRVYERLYFEKVRIRHNTWQDPSGTWRSAVDYRLSKSVFLSHLDEFEPL